MLVNTWYVVNSVNGNGFPATVTSGDPGDPIGPHGTVCALSIGVAIDQIDARTKKDPPLFFVIYGIENESIKMKK